MILKRIFLFVENKYHNLSKNCHQLLYMCIHMHIHMHMYMYMYGCICICDLHLVIIALADVLAPRGARTSAGTALTKISMHFHQHF